MTEEVKGLHGMTDREMLWFAYLWLCDGKTPEGVQFLLEDHFEEQSRKAGATA